MDLQEEIKKAKDVPPADFETFAVGDLIKQEFPIPPQILKDGLFDEKGGMVIGGAPKAGKSLLATQLAFSVACGVDFLDFECARPKESFRTLYLNAEMPPYQMSEQRIKPNLKFFTSDRAKEFVHIAFPFSTLRLDRKEGIQKLGQMLDAIEPHILIIDPIVNFHSGDENNVQDMNKLTTLAGAIQANGTAVILCHHMRKGSGRSRNLSDTLRGSSALGGWYATCLALSRSTKHKQELGIRKLEFDCRFCEAPPPKLLYIDDETKIMKEITDEYEETKTIEEYLHEVGTTGMPATELRSKFRGQPEFKSRLTTLIKSGNIVEMTAPSNSAGRPKKYYVHKDYV